jgi:hypothetical protein
MLHSLQCLRQREPTGVERLADDRPFKVRTDRSEVEQVRYRRDSARGDHPSLGGTGDRTSSSPMTAAKNSAFEPRLNAASRSTKWIHSAPAACQASATSNGLPGPAFGPVSPRPCRATRPLATSTAGNNVNVTINTLPRVAIHPPPRYRAGRSAVRGTLPNRCYEWLARVPWPCWWYLAIRRRRRRRVSR